MLSYVCRDKPQGGVLRYFRSGTTVYLAFRYGSIPTPVPLPLIFLRSPLNTERHWAS